MPHKKNPILSENISGLARLIRNYAGAAFENQALWHERDISHSSVERVIGPDATSATEFCLLRMNDIVAGLDVDTVQMKHHVDASRGLIYSEKLLLELLKRGADRQEIYPAIQRAAMRARQSKSLLSAEVKNDKSVMSYVSSLEIDDIFDSKYNIDNVDLIFDRVSQACAKPVEQW